MVVVVVVVDGVGAPVLVKGVIVGSRVGSTDGSNVGETVTGASEGTEVVGDLEGTELVGARTG